MTLNKRFTNYSSCAEDGKTGAKPATFYEIVKYGKVPAFEAFDELDKKDKKTIIDSYKQGKIIKTFELHEIYEDIYDLFMSPTLRSVSGLIQKPSTRTKIGHISQKFGNNFTDVYKYDW